ncbi:DUF1080 domain-containing protein [Sediminibacterium roseum]|uniref:DUF1080 domain-containing protein n=1 Tax=Sediminibacterium roseum TaxID=1978412 RepID=A0ABW9ZNG9_9BACT|nr:DUF1080 domain-containing protein [Sediminibacterium roseum]NCI48444.1 DUF1080 domain-containing protein [Sediminibacterium roseum]
MQSYLTIPVLALVMLMHAPTSNKTIASINVPQKGFVSLFDGKSLKGWHVYGHRPLTEAWSVQDGAIFFDRTKKANGDLLTDNQYENFHLKYDWKISPKGNSGVIFWVQEDTARYKQTYHTGPEMQVLDNDGHKDGSIVKHRAGNLYDLIAGKEGAVKPVGEWNTAEIISNKGKLEFILNGVSVLTTNYGDDNWKQMVAGSKFKQWPDFGTIFKGHIALQNHDSDVWYKNIVIKQL